MLFHQQFLDGIRAGSITLAFRRWRRLSVRAGGTQITTIGQLQIGDVSQVSEREISQDDARRAGYASCEALLAELNQPSEGEVYRIEILGVRPDSRIALGEAVPGDAESDTIVEKLRRLDSHPNEGAWTSRVLDVIARHPGVRAGDLCRMVKMEKDAFKVNVRKLKRLGLTESLETGYRISPRGEAVRRRLKS